MIFVVHQHKISIADAKVPAAIFFYLFPLFSNKDENYMIDKTPVKKVNPNNMTLTGNEHENPDLLGFDGHFNPIFNQSQQPHGVPGAQALDFKNNDGRTNHKQDIDGQVTKTQDYSKIATNGTNGNDASKSTGQDPPRLPGGNPAGSSVFLPNNTGTQRNQLQYLLYNPLLQYHNPSCENYYYYPPNPKLSPFCTERPDLWFITVEVKFNTTRTDDGRTKYLTVIKALDHETLEQLSDIAQQEPAQDKYKTLKGAIISRLSDSRQKQIHPLLRETILDNRKPSQLLRQMRELANGAVDDMILHQLWLERIPHQIKPHLITSSKLPLDAIAEFADHFFELLSTSQVMATAARNFSSHSTQNPVSTDLKFLEIQKTLDQCLRELNELKIQQQKTQQQLLQQNLQQQQLLQQQTQFQQENQQLPHQSYNRSRPRSQTPVQNGICYYHQRYGKEARRCTLPCKFASSVSTNNQKN